ncbi:3-oxoacyl-[acyl-carrier-protein] synthase III C-terminal domain-containing protein [Maribacter sp. 2-571]|uniref:3-oxoacyl-[acyl-carrier-protein] synthase III C-terminal domain-containing protein n=1 Tax=Maribacter sp. 2-571 TaxID=3417569 RepID=UPI003D3508F9
MKISGLSAVFPSTIVTNQEVIEILEKESRKKYNYSLSIPREALLDKLNSTEIKTRRWLSKNESRIDLISEAIDNALIDANLLREDIDLILYASVHKQFKEPGDSFFIAKALGFKSIECFDVLEACNSFVRASHIAQAYLETNSYKNILVITSEFMVHDDEHLSSFQISDIKNLEYAFSTLTVGEGTTATIFTASEHKWKQKIVGLPQHANCCFMTAANISSEDKTKYGLNGQDFVVNQFISYGLKLHKGGSSILRDMVVESLEKRELSDIVFPHTHSKVAWDKFGQGLKLKVPYYHIFQDYGNLVSSSLPVGMYLARKEGKLKRNMKVSAWMAAAGMSLSVTDFKF